MSIPTRLGVSQITEWMQNAPICVYQDPRNIIFFLDPGWIHFESLCDGNGTGGLTVWLIEEDDDEFKAAWKL